MNLEFRLPTFDEKSASLIAVPRVLVMHRDSGSSPRRIKKPAQHQQLALVSYSWYHQT